MLLPRGSSLFAVMMMLLFYVSPGNGTYEDSEWWDWKLATWLQNDNTDSSSSSSSPSSSSYSSSGASSSSSSGPDVNHVDGRKPTECTTNRMNCVNFAPESNEKLNELVNVELGASYAYKMMQQYFAREDAALRGFSKFFGSVAQVEATYAQTMMEYINLRGGDIELSEVPRPSKSTWADGLDAVKDALAMEQAVTNMMLDLHQLAELRDDPSLQHFLEENFLGGQHDRLNQYATYETILTKFALDPVAQNIFDSQLYDGSR